ncbi:hypothetical protein M8120_15150 [Microcystis aeruginosa str. Chao 1910]|nr:hypothetical protein [Microcystis aeruginosa]UZO74249.1 hypothetical protein M8120_15150 [Microcystis aeruginosa str. Chao 1910]
MAVLILDNPSVIPVGAMGFLRGCVRVNTLLTVIIIRSLLYLVIDLVIGL